MQLPALLFGRIQIPEYDLESVKRLSCLSQTHRGLAIEVQSEKSRIRINREDDGVFGLSRQSC